MLSIRGSELPTEMLERLVRGRFLPVGFLQNRRIPRGEVRRHPLLFFPTLPPRARVRFQSCSRTDGLHIDLW